MRLVRSDRMRQEEGRCAFPVGIITHMGAKTECWEYQIVVMKECAHSASDSLSYFELVRKAEQCLAENDFAGVNICQRRSWELIPSEELTERRFSDASLRKM